MAFFFEDRTEVTVREEKVMESNTRIWKRKLHYLFWYRNRRRGRTTLVGNMNALKIIK